MGATASGRGAGPVGDRCAGCGSRLAADQRYCLECGTRVGALTAPRTRAAAAQSKLDGEAGPASTLALPFGLPPLRVPKPRSASAMAALTLAFGVFVGLAIGPGFPGAGLATSRFVLQLPAAAEQASTEASGAASASATLGSPVGNVAAAPVQKAPQGAPQAPVSTEAPPPAQEPPPKGHPKNGGGSGHGPALPPSHEKPTVEGVVVHVNPVAESYSIATTDEDHQLIAIHDEDLPDPGTRVKVRLRELFNGTFAEAGDRTENGTETQATFDGMVTYRDPEAGVYTVSKTGSSVLIHVPQSAAPPPVNQEVVVTATVKPAPAAKARRAERAHRPRRRHRSAVELAAAKVQRDARRAEKRAADGCSDEPIPGPDPSSTLEQRSYTIVGPAYGSVDVEGIVERACASDAELGLSADDIRESESDITVASPDDEIDLSLLELGKPVDATVRIDEKGSYELTGVSSDDGVAGADDPETGQGDQAPE